MGADVWEPFARNNHIDRASAGKKRPAAWAPNHSNVPLASQTGPKS